MKKLSDEFVLSIGMLLTSFLMFQAAILPNIFKDQDSLTATVSKSSTRNIYDMKESSEYSGTFLFKYEFATSPKFWGETPFDLPIVPFDPKKALTINEAFSVTDAWGYPVRENAFMTESGRDGTRDNRSDEDPDILGLVNCRANTDIEGYFKAYFEDVALGNAVGYDDIVFGEGRREEVCQVLQDISELIRLDETDVTPDIIFMADPGNIPPNALAGASSYFNNALIESDNGFLHRHIISQEDPTPAEGMFDAFVLTNFDGVNWDIDTDLNPGTYDMYSVMYHEIVHTLGFRGLLPAVITNSGSTYHHDTFDSFSFRSDSLTDRFIDPSDLSLDTPNGAPSQWFITDDVVYRGIKNLVGAVPDGIRPVYSPAVWQQGSSLSHFDMTRSNGQVYVMHPSIGTNTERQIHDHEKEVLCHLGYRVDGITGCEDATPWAENDTAIFPEGGSVCVKPLLNDVSFEGGELKINDVISLDTELGDTFTYYSSGINCTGTVLPDAVGAKTFSFASGGGSSVRLLAYRDRDMSSNRFSNQASIRLVSECNSDPDEYICNGDFEMTVGQDQESISCPNGWDPYASGTTYWCNSFDEGAFVLSNFEDPQLFVQNNDNFIADVNSFPWAFSNELLMSLVAGEEYILSFDMRGDNFNNLTMGLNMEPLVNYPGTWYDDAASTPDQIIPVTELGEPIAQTSQGQWWRHYEIPLTADDDYESFIFGSPFSKLFLDNMSIRRMDTVPEQGANVISGIVYYDLDMDGQKDIIESGLNGIEVGIFEPNESTPFDTTYTEDTPDVGRYTFSDLSDGLYRVALMNESTYPAITEPESNTYIPGYSHARTLYVVDGQVMEGNDFGVVLEVGATPNIRLKKGLIDSSLSIIDRNITWQIEAINNGDVPASNVNILDLPPTPLVYYSHVTPPPNTYTPNTGIWHIPSIQPGQTILLQITMKVPAGTCGTKTNVASLVSLNETDLDPTDNTASALIKLRGCNVSTELETVK